MAFIFQEDLIRGMLTGMLVGVPAAAVGVATYVLTALALHGIARRRGLRRPWLAWIPVVNCWILGSVSDQYHYVVRGEVKSKRKILLTLRILSLILTAMVVILGVAVWSQLASGMMRGLSQERVMQMAAGSLVGVLGLCLPLLGVGIAYTIVRYMALYDVYKSLDPNNCVLFLVLSIFIRITEPCFLFFSRNKEDGMPPRRQTPTSDIPREPWMQGEPGDGE